MTGIVDLGAATLADGSATPAPLTGLLIDGIVVSGTCGWLDLVDAGTFEVIDSAQTLVPCIPAEPTTIALLGLGTLLLRRRNTHDTARKSV